jgi:O-antigen/teichoic acid export membrane protein
MKNKAETAIDVSDDTEDVFDDEKVAQLKKKTVSGAASYMIRTTLLHGLSIVSVGVLAAYLTEADVGIYGIVLQIVGLLAFFSDIGFGSALIQKKTEPTLTEYRTVFTVQQLLAATIFIITVGIAASGVLEPKIGHAGAWVLIALGFSFPAVTLKTISSVMLERKLDFGTLVIPQVVEQVLYNGVLMILAVQGFGVMAYCYAILARTIAGVALMF